MRYEKATIFICDYFCAFQYVGTVGRCLLYAI